MSFGFGGSQAQNAGPGNARAEADLGECETELFGFQSAAGNDKLRLLPSPWPSDSQPPAAASLLSVASGKGLVAAAGPDTLVIASTERVRETFSSGPAENNIKSFTPQATLSIPRVNQVAFSSDESCLVIAAEQGGGLAVYDTNALVNGGQEPAFEIATNGVSVRQLVPNPNPSPDFAQYFGIVLEGGQLLLADLKERKLVNNSGGNAVFHEKVTSACWSRLGRQLVAGRSDGTAVQIDPRGNVKAEIPRPPQLANLGDSRAIGHPLTSIYWLETHDFLLIHSPENPTQSADDMEMPPEESSFYHLAHRDMVSNSWSFQTIVDPTPAFIQDGRVPARHFVQRLKDWPPNLDDVLVLLSTISTETGVLTKSKTALNPQQPFTNVFTTTAPLDTRRAGLPLSIADQISDTSAIGMALDLSAKEKITKPIPTNEEIDVSPVPLPALYVLNNEGILSMWWIVDNASVQTNTPFPDLIAAGGPRPLDAKSASAPAPPASSFGSGAMPPTPAQPFSTSGMGAFGGASQLGGRSSPWGAPPAATPSVKPSQPVFGSRTSLGGGGGFGGAAASVTVGNKPAFGSNTSLGGSGAFGGAAATSTPAFGKPSTPNGSSAFSSTSATSAPAFGKASTPNGGSGFGQVGGLGAKQSVWGAPTSSSNTASPGTTGSVFGGNASQQSPFSTFGQPSKPTAANPFAPFGQDKPATSPFAAVNTAENKPAALPFGSAESNDNKPAVPPFAAFASTENKFSPFGIASSSETKADSFSSFGKPSLPNQPSGTTLSFGSGSAFGSGSTVSQNGLGSFGSPSASREETMDEESGPSKPAEEKNDGSGSGLFGSGTSGFKLGSTFKGDGSAKDDLPMPKNPGAGLFGSSFGQSLGETQKEPIPTTPIKKEPGTDEKPGLKDIPSFSTTPAAPPKPQEQKADDPLLYKAKRFFGDVPPSDVPAFVKPTIAEPPKDIPRRFAGDVPPSDVPAFSEPAVAEPPKEIPKRFFGDIPPLDVPGEVKTDDQSSRSELKKEDSSSHDAPLAGSPPVDLGSEKTSADDDDLPAGPEDDDEEEWSEEEDDEGEEDEEPDEDGEEEDEEEDQDEDEDDYDDVDEDEDEEPSITDQNALSAFEARITPASPKRNEKQTESTTPATLAKKPTYTPAGFPKAPVDFPIPRNGVNDSPRSPSPQRSVTAPVFAKSPMSTPLPPQIQRISVPPSKPAERPARTARPAEADSGDLEDDEDANVQAVLSTTPTATKEVPEFLAHQNYVGKTEKPGIGGQIERVYRDINSMVDTLGLNAHSLQGFVNGNKELGSSGERRRDDLDDEDGWAFNEIEDLQILQKHLENDLEGRKLEEVREKVEILRVEEREAVRLHAKMASVRKQIALRTGPEETAARLAAPLPTDSQAQQSELRQKVQDVQTMLAKAEESMTMLRADLASSASTKGTANIPTVEAVMNTIQKMTAMIEQKSGDIDVLEAQIRRLPNGIASLNLKDDYEDDLVSALRTTELVKSSPRTPSTRRQRRAFNGDPLGMSGMLGSRFQTPPAQSANRRSLMFSPEASALGRSIGSVSGSARKKMMDVTEGEITAYQAKKLSRARVMDALKEGIERRGPRVVHMER
ncbi:Hypothetical protein R9X50_00075400 [Acrodontium crateriforme]|uniref:Nucleoporin Nup159/Nup146 N-terminal domain-containing protein n=1 Tax=Acrodontium crateriforme TaxID=150365 RepID=A0AAQ3LXU8_9PEZI|nr:Hypothetical protein R9X50_00075400 [Acrodontium crateriforme]